MSKNYVVNGPNASGTANKTCVNVIGSAAIRPMVNYFAVGPTTAPNATDQNYEFIVARTTAAGTAGSSPTPLALDPGDAAAVATAAITHSAEPTYAATLLMQMYVNQRGTFQWYAAPGGEFIGSATSANGVALKLSAVTAAMVLDGTVQWRE